MIVILSGTNRKNSLTLRLADWYQEILSQMTDEDIHLVSIGDVQKGLLHEDMYEEEGQSSILRKLQDDFFIPATRWIIIAPEYNGSFPGILKLFIDALSVRAADRTFHHKKVLLAGISSGRTGNWLGMNQLTSVLQYLKMHVYFNKLALNHISTVLDKKDELSEEKAVRFIRDQIKGFLEF